MDELKSRPFMRRLAEETEKLTGDSTENKEKTDDILTNSGPATNLTEDHQTGNGIITDIISGDPMGGLPSADMDGEAIGEGAPDSEDAKPPKPDPLTIALEEAFDKPLPRFYSSPCNNLLGMRDACISLNDKLKEIENRLKPPEKRTVLKVTKKESVDINDEEKAAQEKADTLASLTEAVDGISTNISLATAVQSNGINVEVENYAGEGPTTNDGKNKSSKGLSSPKGPGGKKGAKKGKGSDGKSIQNQEVQYISPDGTSMTSPRDGVWSKGEGYYGKAGGKGSKKGPGKGEVSPGGKDKGKSPSPSPKGSPASYSSGKGKK